MGSGQSFVFSGRLVGLPRAGGRLALSGQSARRRLHLPFCPMKGFVIWPGMGAVPVFPLAFPTVPQLKKLSSGGTELLHPPPPPALYNLFVPTSLFCNQGGKKKEKSLFSFLPISRDQQKTRCLVEMVVNNQAEPLGWLERGCLSRGLAEGRWGPSCRLTHTKDTCSLVGPSQLHLRPSPRVQAQEGEEVCGHLGC